MLFLNWFFVLCFVWRTISSRERSQTSLTLAVVNVCHNFILSSESCVAHRFDLLCCFVVTPRALFARGGGHKGGRGRPCVPACLACCASLLGNYNFGARRLFLWFVALSPFFFEPRLLSFAEQRIFSCFLYGMSKKFGILSGSMNSLLPLFLSITNICVVLVSKSNFDGQDTQQQQQLAS